MAVTLIVAYEGRSDESTGFTAQPNVLFVRDSSKQRLSPIHLIFPTIKNQGLTSDSATTTAVAICFNTLLDSL